MTKCSRCGKEMGSAANCPECGYPPSQSVVGKSVDKAAHVTGDVLEKGVHVGEKVAKETKPVLKKALSLGKKGVTKAKDTTLKVAKDLKDE